MPFVERGEGADVPFADLRSVASRAGVPPWREILAGTPGMRVVLLGWPPGYATIPHVHPHAEEIFLVVEGRATFRIGSAERAVGPGEFMFAPRGTRHVIRVAGDGPLTLLAAVAPNEDVADETVEFPE